MLKQIHGMQSLEQHLGNVLKPIFSGSKKEFILINNLVKNWPEIIGKKYEKFCYPKSVQIAKDKSVQSKLTIAVHNSAAGFFIENNQEIILEKIAALYGFKALGKIIVKQEPKKIVEKVETKLKENQKKFLSDRLGKISDLNLAESLRQLGEEILCEEYSTKNPNK